MKNIKFILWSLLLLISLPTVAQQTLKGIVIEASSGEPLPGVNVVVKGTTRGTSTDFDGKFDLPNVKSGDVIVFSSLGYAEQEATISNNFNLNISMQEGGNVLDEVVVVGYGTTTVKDATGSVEAITEKEFTKGNIVTPENLLSGRVAGVSITTSGAPGSGSAIRIRGGSSVNGSNDPLIIIDGLPIDNNGVSGSRGILANLNPNDIASFSVLKDASSTAIYGSRASNGVIIITTKKGKSTWSMDFDSQFTFGENQRSISVFGADEFRNLVAQRQPGNVGLLGNANTNWQDEIFRNTVSSQYNLTARGTIEDFMPARFSLGFNDIEGALQTSNFSRNNFSVALSPSFFDDHLKINLNYNAAAEESRFADSGVVRSALRYDPTQEVYDSNSPFGGFYQHLTDQGNLANGGTNPVAQLLQSNNQGNALRQFGNIQLDYKMHFLPELKAVVNLGYDETEGESLDVSSLLSPAREGAQFIGNDSQGNQLRTNKLLDAYLNFKKGIAKDLNLDFTAGYSHQKFTNSSTSTGNRRNPNNKTPPDFVEPDVVLIGFFGRANFSYLDKYLLTLNYRRDGTSRFTDKNKWGNFPGAALAWKINEEDFLKDSKTISSLKLRASYGITGQQDIFEKDVFLSRYRQGNANTQYLFGGVPINILAPLGISPDIKWEETATIEFGIDYGLFNGRYNGSLNFFQKNSTDLLFSADLPSGVNYTNRIVQNIGELQIRGIEFSLNADIIRQEDVNLDFNFNASYFDREMTSLANGLDVATGGISGGFGNNIQVFREGEAPRSFLVYKQLRDAQGKPIEGAFLDLNGDGSINEEDLYTKGNPDADVILGFQTNFNYKNFDLSFNLRASIGNLAYNNVEANNAIYDQINDQSVSANLPTSITDNNFEVSSGLQRLSDIYVEDASFLKMDNITFGYTFDRPIKKFSKNSIRLWAGVQNVFVLTNYRGLDPEVFNGIDNIVYPRSRNILVGANIKF